MGKTHLAGVEPGALNGARALHHGLACFNARRWGGLSAPTGWPAVQDQGDELAWRRRENEFLEALREDVSLLLPSPDLAPDAFMAWFKSLAKRGPGQPHRLLDWLANSATLEDMQWFLRQEAAGEAGLAAGWPSLALANTMLGLTSSRRYTYQWIGALGVVELVARKRAKRLSRGMRRLGLKGRARAIAAAPAAHPAPITLEVIRPLIVADHGCARLIAEGALMRLLCVKHCLDGYAEKRMPRAGHHSASAPAPAAAWMALA